MKLNAKAIALAAAILWGGALLLTGIAGMIWAGYGSGLLSMAASLYPGYHASGAFGDLIAGTLYAALDGGVCGLLFAWLYNLFAEKMAGPSASD